MDDSWVDEFDLTIVEEFEDIGSLFDMPIYSPLTRIDRNRLIGLRVITYNHASVDIAL